MLIISFAWTTDALLAGRKRRTRRNWSLRYAKQFRAGMICQAYDKNPRIGGKQIALVRLTKTPYQQSTRWLTEEDYELEGLAWMEEEGVLIRGETPRVFFNAWKSSEELVYVVDFELYEDEQVPLEPLVIGARLPGLALSGV